VAKHSVPSRSRVVATNLNRGTALRSRSRGSDIPNFTGTRKNWKKHSLTKNGEVHLPACALRHALRSHNAQTKRTAAAERCRSDIPLQVSAPDGSLPTSANVNLKGAESSKIPGGATSDYPPARRVLPFNKLPSERSCKTDEQLRTHRIYIAPSQDIAHNIQAQRRQAVASRGTPRKAVRRSSEKPLNPL